MSKPTGPLMRLSSFSMGSADPFSYHTPFTSREVLKAVLLTVTLVVPLRMLCLVAFFITMSVLAKLYVLGKRLSVKHAFLGHALQLPFDTLTGPLCRAALFVCFGFFRIHVKGTPSKDVTLLASNHCTLIDALVIRALVPFSVVSRAENAQLPVVGDCLRAVQALLVRRHSKGSKSATLDAMVKRARDTTTKQPPLLIFPEGTTTNGQALITFKRGTFACGMPVQPICLQFPHEHFNPAWVAAGPGMGGLALRMMAQVYNSATITFLPVCTPSDVEKEDPIAFASRVQFNMSKVLRVPVTSHMLEDAMLLAMSNRSNIKLNVAPQELRNLYGTSVKHVKGMLERFSAVDVNKDGIIDFDEFCNAFGLQPDSEYAMTVFDTLDQNGDGELDFREFVVAVLLARPVSSECTRDEKVRLAFSVFDLQGDEMVDEHEARQVLRSVGLLGKYSDSLRNVFGDATSSAPRKVSFRRFTSVVTREEDLLQVLPPALVKFSDKVFDKQ